MIGIGKWHAEIESNFISGDGLVTVSDNNGQYGFNFEIKDTKIPEIIVKSIEEDGNTLNIIAQCDLLKGKDIPLSVTFDGDSMTGFLKIPFAFVGKVNFSGKKIYE